MLNSTLELPLFAPEFDPEDPRLPKLFRCKFEVRDVPRHHLAADLGPCWIWTAAKQSGNYGTWKLKGKQTCAHIFAYRFLIGDVPEAKELDHRCRNRDCVNPGHLEAVVRRVNILRGIGLSSMNAKKTHCPEGHPLSGDNVKIYKNQRRCRTCVLTQQRARYHANPEYHIRQVVESRIRRTGK